MAEVIQVQEVTGVEDLVVIQALEATEATLVQGAMEVVTLGQEGTVESLAVTPGHMVVTRALEVTLAQVGVS